MVSRPLRYGFPEDWSCSRVRFCKRSREQGPSFRGRDSRDGPETDPCGKGPDLLVSSEVSSILPDSTGSFGTSVLFTSVLDPHNEQNSRLPVPPQTRSLVCLFTSSVKTVE